MGHFKQPHQTTTSNNHFKQPHPSTTLPPKSTTKYSKNQSNPNTIHTNKQKINSKTPSPNITNTTYHPIPTKKTLKLLPNTYPIPPFHNLIINLIKIHL